MMGRQRNSHPAIMADEGDGSQGNDAHNSSSSSSSNERDASSSAADYSAGSDNAEEILAKANRAKAIAGGPRESPAKAEEEEEEEGDEEGDEEDEEEEEEELGPKVIPMRTTRGRR